MNTATAEEFDVVVVGGGPGGSTLAALVAMRGHRVLVLEKETFPRYQIGESLLPSTVHGICRLSGAADELGRAGFMRKRGGTFKWGTSPEPWTFSFAVSPKMTGPTSYAYQVERMKFDQILLDNARLRGAQVREGCAVGRVTEADGRVTGVEYADADGTRHEARARYVIDASGNKSRISGSAGGERRYSEFFRNLAIFGYFENGKRLPEPNSGNILSVAFDGGWFWYIPLSPTLTSVGAVVRQELASKVQGEPRGLLRNLISECPLISEYLADATPVRQGPYGQVRVRKDYSYHQTRFWRPGLALIGDAACFVDPVFSSGVHLATYSALLAARSINSVLAGQVSERAAFEEFEARYRREYGVFYEFLTSFYDMHASEDSYFWTARKVTAARAGGDLQAFVELVGGVSSGETALAGSEAAARLRAGSAEFSAAIGAVAADTEGSMLPLLGSTVVRQAMAEGAQVQTRAVLGAALGPEQPLFPAGLVPSPDGLLWETTDDRAGQARDTSDLRRRTSSRPDTVRA